MTTLPPIQIPDVPGFSSRSAIDSPAPPKTPKSLLKNLFTWKKASATQDPIITSPLDVSPEERPQTACSTKHGHARKPSFSQRSRSDNAVPQRSKSKTRPKSRRRSRSRCRAIWDPPPLFQAYNQAFMHDVLQIPNKGFLDWLPRNSGGRSGAKNSDSIEDDHEEMHSPAMSHRRSLSDSMTSTLSKKHIFLFENGHILQYKAEGSQDRLPERVLELSRDSVAFASDAIAGQHWVLEICPYGRADEESRTASFKSPWSRVSLKAPDNKRLSEKLLLVFDSADTLFTWLIAIRKQIEGLGGLEYQPDTSPSSQTESKRPTLRHASSEYFKKKNNALFSRSSSALPLKISDHTAHEKELPQIPAHLSYKPSVSTRSIAASSVATNTSLDRLRESYSGSSTAGTTLSSDTSATSLSPTKDTFAPMLSPVLGRSFKDWINVDRTAPRTSTSPLPNSEEIQRATEKVTLSEKNVGPSILETSIDRAIELQNTQAEPVLRSVPQVVVEDDTGMQSRGPPISVLDPIPIPEFRKRLRQAQRNMLAEEGNSKINTDARSVSNTARGHATKPSLGTSKGAYGLFPKKLALDVKAEPLVVTEQNHVPGLSRTQATDHLEISQSPITPVAATFGDHLFARSQTTSKRPAPIALPRFLAPLEIEQPMRSPAVTDAMLDSNFGMGPSGAATQPPTPVQIRVPSFSDLNVDKNLLNSLRDIETQTVTPTTSPKRQSLTPRRSMPNFHSGTNGAPSAPVGPPPNGPLPAVPPANEGRNSRNSTPSKRTSTQSSGNRRASTKSTASVKKTRSPVPSYSLPSAHRHRSLSSSVKSPVLVGVQAVSPCMPTAPSPQIAIPPITIGQLSVVSIPPRVIALPQHKKSLSTSSINSNQSKRTHKRSASSKSIPTSIANLPLFSHLVPPLDGLQIDMGPDPKYCFGFSGSRSST